jgi:opacity protein-like surface antigen
MNPPHCALHTGVDESRDIRLPMPVVVRICAVLAACAAALFLLSASAFAADLPNAPSSYPALTTSPSDSEWNPWSGLYLGTGISAWGGKGVKGGVGGEGYLGYDHAFDNGVVVGVRASSGYEPFLWASPNGFSQFTGNAYAGGSAIVGYQMGQLTPYVIAGVDLARPTRFGSFSALDNVNAVFSGPGAVQAVGTVGVGATYRVNSNLSFGVEAIMNYAPAASPYWFH